MMLVASCAPNPCIILVLLALFTPLVIQPVMKIAVLAKNPCSLSI